MCFRYQCRKLCHYFSNITQKFYFEREIVLILSFTFVILTQRALQMSWKLFSTYLLAVETKTSSSFNEHKDIAET